MSRNRISSGQVDSGPLARSQRRAGICWDGDGAYGIHSWKSTELQAGGAAGPPRCWNRQRPSSGVHPPPQHPPQCGDPPREAVVVFILYFSRRRASGMGKAQEMRTGLGTASYWGTRASPRRPAGTWRPHGKSSTAAARGWWGRDQNICSASPI